MSPADTPGQSMFSGSCKGCDKAVAQLTVSESKHEEGSCVLVAGGLSAYWIDLFLLRVLSGRIKESRAF